MSRVTPLHRGGSLVGVFEEDNWRTSVVRGGSGLDDTDEDDEDWNPEDPDNFEVESFEEEPDAGEQDAWQNELPVVEPEAPQDSDGGSRALKADPWDPVPDDDEEDDDEDDYIPIDPEEDDGLASNDVQDVDENWAATMPEDADEDVDEFADDLDPDALDALAADVEQQQQQQQPQQQQQQQPNESADEFADEFADDLDPDALDALAADVEEQKRQEQGQREFDMLEAMDQADVDAMAEAYQDEEAAAAEADAQIEDQDPVYDPTRLAEEQEAFDDEALRASLAGWEQDQEPPAAEAPTATANDAAEDQQATWLQEEDPEEWASEVVQSQAYEEPDPEPRPSASAALPQAEPPVKPQRRGLAAALNEVMTPADEASAAEQAALAAAQRVRLPLTIDELQDEAEVRDNDARDKPTALAMDTGLPKWMRDLQHDPEDSSSAMTMIHLMTQLTRKKSLREGLVDLQRGVAALIRGSQPDWSLQLTAVTQQPSSCPVDSLERIVAGPGGSGDTSSEGSYRMRAHQAMMYAYALAWKHARNAVVESVYGAKLPSDVNSRVPPLTDQAHHNMAHAVRQHMKSITPRALLAVHSTGTGKTLLTALMLAAGLGSLTVHGRRMHQFVVTSQANVDNMFQRQGPGAGAGASAGSKTKGATTRYYDYLRGLLPEQFGGMKPEEFNRVTRLYRFGGQSAFSLDDRRSGVGNIMTYRQLYNSIKNGPRGPHQGYNDLYQSLACGRMFLDELQSLFGDEDAHPEFILNWMAQQEDLTLVILTATPAPNLFQAQQILGMTQWPRSVKASILAAHLKALAYGASVPRPVKAGLAEALAGNVSFYAAVAPVFRGTSRLDPVLRKGSPEFPDLVEWPPIACTMSPLQIARFVVGLLQPWAKAQKQPPQNMLVYRPAELARELNVELEEQLKAFQSGRSVVPPTRAKKAAAVSEASESMWDDDADEDEDDLAGFIVSGGAVADPGAKKDLLASQRLQAYARVMLREVNGAALMRIEETRMFQRPYLDTWNTKAAALIENITRLQSSADTAGKHVVFLGDDDKRYSLPTLIRVFAANGCVNVTKEYLHRPGSDEAALDAVEAAGTPYFNFGVTGRAAGAGEASPSLMRRINSGQNKKGRVIAVVLLQPGDEEGLDFKWGLYAHCFAGQFNESRLIQFKGRFQRMCARGDDKKVHYFEYHAVLGQHTLRMLEALLEARFPGEAGSSAAAAAAASRRRLLVEPSDQAMLNRELQYWQRYCEFLDREILRLKTIMQMNGLQEKSPTQPGRHEVFWPMVRGTGPEALGPKAIVKRRKQPAKSKKPARRMSGGAGESLPPSGTTWQGPVTVQQLLTTMETQDHETPIRPPSMSAAVSSAGSAEASLHGGGFLSGLRSKFSNAFQGLVDRVKAWAPGSKAQPPAAGPSSQQGAGPDEVLTPEVLARRWQAQPRLASLTGTDILVGTFRPSSGATAATALRRMMGLQVSSIVHDKAKELAQWSRSVRDAYTQHEYTREAIESAVSGMKKTLTRARTDARTQPDTYKAIMKTTVAAYKDLLSAAHTAWTMQRDLQAHIVQLGETAEQVLQDQMAFYNAPEHVMELFVPSEAAGVDKNLAAAAVGNWGVTPDLAAEPARDAQDLFGGKTKALWSKAMLQQLKDLINLMHASPEYKAFLQQWDARYSPDVYFTHLRKTLFGSLQDVLDVLRAAAVDCEALSAFHASLGYPATCDAAAT